jgi:superfamily II DNA/RNA helicase
MLNIFHAFDIRVRSLVGINTDRVRSIVARMSVDMDHVFVLKDPLNFTLGEVDIIVSTPGILLRLLRQGNKCR